MAKKKTKTPKKISASKKVTKPQPQKQAVKPALQKPPAPAPSPAAIKKPVPTAAKPALGTGPVRIFPTVCYVFQQPNTEKMNRELERIIMASEVKGQDLQRSAIKGGYRSDRTFLDTDNWAVKELKNLITNHALKYLRSYWKHESSTPLEKIANFKMKLNGWSVILREGDAGAPHIHPRANISGVYYISAPQEKAAYRGAGNIILADPRIRAAVAPVREQISSIMIPPVGGLFVMFPSYIEHYILPFKGPGTRISVAYNLTFSPTALSQGY
jgi:uncharacterized protein (TIGR02466 family)